MAEQEKTKDEFIHIPRDWLTAKVLTDPCYARAVLYLAKEIADNGVASITSSEAEARFGLSHKRYRTLLDLLEKGKQTGRQRTNKRTNITIEYQCAKSAEGQTKGKQKGKQKQAKFLPPTEQEAIEFITEKGYHFNPAEFVSWNQSKGWKVGNQPMKDWRAACQTWEIRWKEKYGDKFYYQIGAADNAPHQQKDRYSDLESAAETILRYPENLDSRFNDKG